MKGITLAALMVAGMMVFTGIAVGLHFTKYDEGSSIGAENSLQPIELRFTVDEYKVTVSYTNGIICDGDVITIYGDETFHVSTVDGQKHTINWNGSWSNPDGEHSGTSGTHYTISMNITVQDFIYYSKATGTMSITVSD